MIDVEKERSYIPKYNTTTAPDGTKVLCVFIVQEDYAELLDAYETLQALEWADRFIHQDTACKDCPMLSRCPREIGLEWCTDDLNKHKSEWLEAYRNREKEE